VTFEETDEKHLAGAEVAAEKVPFSQEKDQGFTGSGKNPVLYQV
jgi:hypothetical protein